MKDKYTKDSYNPSACCDADCSWYGWKESEPCWGDVSLIDEVETEDGDYAWVHACEGHYFVEDGGDYIEEEEDADN